MCAMPPLPLSLSSPPPTRLHEALHLLARRLHRLHRVRRVLHAGHGKRGLLHVELLVEELVALALVQPLLLEHHERAALGRLLRGPSRALDALLVLRQLLVQLADLLVQAAGGRCEETAGNNWCMQTAAGPRGQADAPLSRTPSRVAPRVELVHRLLHRGRRLRLLLAAKDAPHGGTLLLLLGRRAAGSGGGGRAAGRAAAAAGRRRVAGRHRRMGGHSPARRSPGAG